MGTIRGMAAALLVLSACALAPRALAADPAYVVMADGGAVLRVITPGSCPAAIIDGKPRQLSLRIAAGTVPQRVTQSKPELSKPSVFPVNVCETRLPASARKLSVAGAALPVPKAVVNRIVVIGDTGCRLKAADNAYQPCNDPKGFAFAGIAARAAAWKPDLVIHVGDYHYRENPCPAGNTGCAASPWGYGWDAWDADWFSPAAPLFAAAPLALARGNHESCSRAGQGWWRFLAPQPLVAGVDCNDPGNDRAGDDSPAYAVPLGRGVQLAMLDASAVGGKPLAPDDWRFAKLSADWDRLRGLAAAARSTLVVDHYPMLGLAAVDDAGVVTLKPGNLAIPSVFATRSSRLLPPGVDAVLSGHVHLWQQVDFASDHPSQFITGFSGTLEDGVPIPAILPPGTQPAPGTRIAHFSAWTTGFGYMTMQRVADRRWDIIVHDGDGKPIRHCWLKGRRSQCRNGA